MKIIFRFMVMWTVILSASACKKEPAASLDAAFSEVKTSPNYLKSTEASNEANENRSPDYSALFEISKVIRDKAMMTITVTYPEGCGNSTFDLIWNGLVMESNPEMIILYLRRNSDCKLKGEITSRLLTVNLTELMGDVALAQRVRVILCNSSKKANTENSDVQVSGN